MQAIAVAAVQFWNFIFFSFFQISTFPRTLRLGAWKLHKRSNDSRAGFIENDHHRQFTSSFRVNSLFQIMNQKDPNFYSQNFSRFDVQLSAGKWHTNRKLVYGSKRFRIDESVAVLGVLGEIASRCSAAHTRKVSSVLVPTTRLKFSEKRTKN